jgi:hypothetical protein
LRPNIFLLFLALFAITTAGHIFTVDSYLNYAVARSLGSDGSLAIPRFMMTVEGRDGYHYSKLGIGQSVAVLPLYLVGSLVEHYAAGNQAFTAYSREFAIPHDSGRIRAEPQTLIRISDEDGARVFFSALTNAFVTAGLCLMFWLVLGRFGLSRAGALWGTILLAFSTPVWIYARDLFSEPLFALSLVGAFYFLAAPPKADGADGSPRRRLAWAAFFTSTGILARMSFLPIAGILAAYITIASDDRRAGIRQAAKYLAYCIPVVLVIALLNLRRFGSVTHTGYHTSFDKGFSLPLANGLRWNLFSLYRSLFIYAPPVLLFFLGARGFARRCRAQLWLIAAIAGYVLVVYSKWWAWHGGWCWGPRFLVPLIPLMLLPGLVVIGHGRRWLLAPAVVLGALGFVVQLGAVLINYTAAYDYWIKIGRLDWAEAGIQNFSPIATHLKALTTTSPASYDLWIVQAARHGGAAWFWLAGFGAVAGVTLVRLLRKQRR